MKLVVMSFGLKVVDCLLPICSQNITIIAMQALVDLFFVNYADSLHRPLKD